MTYVDAAQNLTVTAPPGRDVSRVIAGQAAKDLINYAGLSRAQVSQMASNLGSRTLGRLLVGESLPDAPYQALAGVLHLPVNLFILIIAGDRAAIEALTMPVYAKEYLAHLLGPVTARR